MAGMQSSKSDRAVETIQKHFSVLRDGRVAGRTLHPLSSVLTVVFLAVLGGNNGWEEIHDFAVDREDWLRARGLLSAGIPSVATMGRVMAMFLPSMIARCVQAIMNALIEPLDGQVLAFDGKTTRGALRRHQGVLPEAFHKVHLWATEQKVMLGQSVVNGAPDEPDALLALLEMLDPAVIAGATITGDANQTCAKVAQGVIDANLDYTFRLKANRTAMFESVRDAFLQFEAGTLDASAVTHHRETNEGHGRSEIREGYCMAASKVPGLTERLPGVRSVLMVISRRLQGIETTREIHYVVSSHRPAVRKLMRQVREHWMVETSLHWCLDVQMGEDRCAVYDANASQNLAILRTLALSILKRDESFHAGIGRKQKKFGRNDEYADHILSLIIP